MTDAVATDTDVTTGPLSLLQERIWLADRTARAGEPPYNEPLVFRVDGPLDVGALRACLARVVQRHEALRTTVVEVAGTLRAGVGPATTQVLEVVDVNPELPGSDAEVEALVGEHYRRPFDLAGGPSLRALLVRRGPVHALLALVGHHIALDAWSFSLILGELAADYRARTALGAPADLPATTGSFREVARAERDAVATGVYVAELEQWGRVLADAPEVMNWPLDRARPAQQTFAGATRRRSFARAGVADLFAQARQRRRSTDYVVLLAAYALLLGRIGDQDRVTVGTTTLNRTRPEHLTTVGCFVNTAALVVDLRDDMTFGALLDEVAARSRAMLRVAHTPWPAVVDYLDRQRDPSHDPLLQTVLTVLGERPGLDLGPGVAVEHRPSGRAAAKFEVLLYVHLGEDEIELEADYNTDLFDPPTVDALLDRYAYVLEHLSAAGPDAFDLPLAEIPVLPDAERARLLDEFNDTTVDRPDTTVPDEVEAQAARTPDAVAVEYEGGTLSYAELDRLTDLVAREIVRRHGDGDEPFVGVYMERSVEMVVALVAILRAGLAYVPIDPDYPADRVRYMIGDADLSLVVTQEDRPLDIDVGAAEVMPLSVASPPLASETPLSRRVGPDSPIYMIYTSGSTGRPKGVVNRHVAVFNRLHWMQQQYGLDDTDRVLQKTPFSFDVSVWEFFWPLIVGARIVVAAPGVHRDPDALKRLVAARGVTTMHFVPSMLSAFLTEDDLHDHVGSLRRVFCSGEALQYPTVAAFAERVGCPLHNLYGPTEAAIDVSHWTCRLDYPGAVVPIGRPISNVTLYVVDRQGRTAPIGVAGELWIGGIGLASGYHRRPELTDAVFVPDTFGGRPGARLYRTGDLARFLHDGQLQYLGRIDSQVKLRGFRIELDEISAVLGGLTGVREAAVVVHEAGPSRMLVAYVVPEGAFDPEPLRAGLVAALPAFMVPQVLVELEALPTTTNGKLDRRSLPDPMASVRTPAAPSRPVLSDEERLVATVWSQVLGVAEPHPHTTFFSYGGDSILVLTIAARLRERGVAVDARDVLAEPTISGLAALIATRRGAVPKGHVSREAAFLLSPEDRARLPRDVEDAWPLTTLQAGMIFHSMSDGDPSVYHDVFEYDLTVDRVDLSVVGDVVADLSRAHPQLRSTFDLDGYGEPVQLVWSDGAVEVGVEDLGPLTADAQEAATRRWVEQEKQRPLDLERGPLLRVRVQRRSPIAMTLILSFHHAVLDGWSVALLVDHFRLAYAARTTAGSSPGAVPPAESVSYGEYVALEREAVLDPGHATFWARHLEARAPTRLGGTGTRPGGAASTVQHERVIPAGVARDVVAAAAALGLPPKAVWLAAHLWALSRSVGRDSVVAGVVTHGRPDVEGAERLYGLFLNTLPLPADVTPGEDLGALAVRVLAAERAQASFRRLPLREIQRHTGVDDWFDMVFNYTDFHVRREGDVVGPVVTGARYYERTNFPMVVHLHRDRFVDSTRLIVVRDDAQVDVGAATRYLDEFVAAAATAGGLVPAESSPSLADADGEEPGDEVARDIAAVIAEAVGLDELGLDEDYLQRGLDSITAIRVVARARRLDLGLTMKDLFERRTVRELRGLVAERSAAASGGAGGGGDARGPAGDRGEEPFALIPEGRRPVVTGVVDAYPATAMQCHMIASTRAEPARASFHDVFTYDVAAPLDVELLRRCLRRVADAHEALRTAFDTDDAGGPLQLVRASADPHLEVLAFPPSDGGAHGPLFTARMQCERATDFDWAGGPPLRFLVHADGPAAFRLTVSFHHAVIDGWSLSLVVRDLLHLYAEGRRGRPGEIVAPTLRPREHVRAELAERGASPDHEFWVAQLNGYRHTSLRTEPGPASTQRWHETTVAVPAPLRARLDTVSVALGVPLKYLLLAVHLRVIGEATGSSDVMTGTFTNTRPELEGGDAVVGMFLNFVPVRQEVRDRTWRELVEATFDDERRALPHRGLPMSDILRGAGLPAFDSLYNYTDFATYGGAVDDAAALVGVEWFEHVAGALLVNVGHDLRGEHMVVTFNVDGRLLSEPSLRQVAERFRENLEDLCSRPDGDLSEPHPGRLRDITSTVPPVPEEST